MKAQMVKLAAVTAMAIGLVFGSAATTMAETSDPGIEHQMKVVGDVANGGRGVIRLSIGQDGTPRVGYMVGRFFVGFLPE